MDWKATDHLGPHQTGHPVEIVGQFNPANLPALDSRWFIEFWGDNKRTSRLRSWGHADGKLSAHFIAVRGGVGFHTDPGFVRYSVHLELFNGGWVTHGIYDTIDDDYPVLVPGVTSVLDTWSPHRVSRDPRLELKSPTKLAAAIDFVDYPPSVPAAIDALIEHLPNLEIPD